MTIPAGSSSAHLSFWHYTISNDSLVRWLPVIFWDRVSEPPSLDAPAAWDMQYMAIDDLTTGELPQIRWGGGVYNNNTGIWQPEYARPGLWRPHDPNLVLQL